MVTEPIFLIVDLFCGAGGTTTGFTQAVIDGNKICKVIACVNHDHKAIISHWRNHPEVKHFEEDIRTLELTELINVVNFQRSRYPEAKLILWASLECTNFSKAKGGQPRDGDSRTLADHLPRYITALKPEYIQIENVVEFMSWGPLNDNGKPISSKNGTDWNRWRKEIDSIGYSNEWKELNSANFGAYTSRNRLFGCFAQEGNTIAWPKPTHAKNPAKHSMYTELIKWKPVKDVLNFSDEGESIFARKKPLSDKTLERIYAGLIKYVAKGDTSFISKYYSGRPSGKVSSINAPAGTLTTVGNQTLVQTEFLLQTYAANSKGQNTFPIDQPARTVTTRDSTQLVQTEFLAHYYGNGFCTSPEDPCPTLRTKDGVTLIKPKYFIDKHFGTAQNQSIDQPAGSILPTDKHRLVEATPFIMGVNPSHGGHTTSTDRPCPVIIARQDKAPLYLLQCEKGSISIAVYDNDTDISIKIKEFMVMYSLVDIKMRMLRVPELLKIQGFPDTYELEGTQGDQKKFIGNSVHPLVPKFWSEVMGSKLIEAKKKVA